VAGLVGSDRLEAGCFPCLVGAGADRRGEERLGLRPAEHELGAVALSALLVDHQLAADDERHRDRAAAGAGLDVDRALDRIPRALHADHAVVEVDVGPLEAAELAASEPAEPSDGPERSLGVGEGGEVFVRALGRLDPIAPAADGRPVEVLGRIESYLVAADRPPEDDPQRVEDVRDRRGGEALAPEAVHEVLDIAPLDLSQLPGSERRDDVGVEELLIAASGRRLVRPSAPVEEVSSWAPLIRTSPASVIVFAVGGRIVPRRSATWASWRHSFAAPRVGKVRHTCRPVRVSYAWAW
jgi:hypothetical protein